LIAASAIIDAAGDTLMLRHAFRCLRVTTMAASSSFACYAIISPIDAATFFFHALPLRHLR